MKKSLLFAFMVLGAAAVPAGADGTLRLALEPAFPKLRFELPVGLYYSPDGTDRLFVIEQKGMISVFPNSPQVVEKKMFLDIRDRVFPGHSEEGLLGLAFHPHYKENGYFFVDYTANNPRRTVIARFSADPKDPDRADPASEQVILEVGQPFGNHNGGQIAFGPDGMLYIAFGDGGSGGDPFNNGQNLATHLGKILRIDVDHSSPGRNFSIPPDNPFAGNSLGYKEEIFAYGLRNPWRFSFDPATKWLWAADVGQDKPYEEIDIIRSGRNYGWNIMEGKHCFKPRYLCHQGGIELPVWEYTANQGRCVTGGFVYRGTRLPELKGNYIYGDFVSGRVWRLQYNGNGSPANELILRNDQLYPSSFGIDEHQEIYICSFDGNIYRFKRME